MWNSITGHLRFWDVFRYKKLRFKYARSKLAPLSHRPSFHFGSQ